MRCNLVRREREGNLRHLQKLGKCTFDAQESFVTFLRILDSLNFYM